MQESIIAELTIFARNTKYENNMIYAKCMAIDSRFVLFLANNLRK